MSRCEQQMAHERQQEMREAGNLNRCLVQNISTISAGYGLLTLVNKVITYVPTYPVWSAHS